MTRTASNAAAAGTAEAEVVDAAASARLDAGSQAPGAKVSSRLSMEGLLAAAGSFVIWGAFPLYLKPLHAVPALQIIAHRVVWACALVFIWLWVRGELGQLGKALTTPTTLGRLSVTALLISVNWLGYVWGVGHGHVLETSLGYFINPLANVLLGVLVLRERLNFAQWTSVGIATGAVVYLAVATGSPPWIALTLAVSFSIYGLIRKVVHVEALQGLAVETLVLMPLALGYLLWCEATGTGAFGHSSPLVNALLVGCGPITAVPLFLFAFGARRIPYSTLGLLLYIAPSLQLLFGIFLYHEPFAGARALGFALIWVALLIYAGDGLWRSRRTRS
jgi:chloramphenicol-sensitive protein RarD